MRVIIIIDPFERRLHAFDLPPVTANLIPGGLRVFAFRLNDSDALYAVEQLASEAGVSDDDIAKQAGNSEAVKKRVHKRKGKHASERSHSKRQAHRREQSTKNAGTK
jgi:hypothetical protein